MKMIIDRFEGIYAVIEMEDGTFQNIPRACIPNNAKEGSIITISCDEDAAEVRRQEMKSKMNSVFKKQDR